METLAETLDNFTQDVLANMARVKTKEQALAALKAIALDALLMEERLNKGDEYGA